jgi:TonB family protein
LRHSLLNAGAVVAATLCGAALAQAQGRPATVAGVVRDPTGMPLVSAEVRVEGTPVRVLTDARGMFAIRDLPSDSMRLIFRRLGFRPSALDVVLQAGHEAEVEVQLDAAPQQLFPITVSARPEVFDARLSGFYERLKQRGGHFITRQRLQRLTSHRFTDLLREVPGVKLLTVGRGPSSATQRSVRLRGADCPPQIFLDGFPATSGEFDLDMLEPSTLEGIEVYHGMATVPAEFLAARGGERCGVVAIWTRPHRPGPARKRGKAVSVADLLSDRAVHLPDAVDIRAELKPTTAIPIYPDSLLAQGRTGRVLMEFVVDTLGLVELETVGIVTSTHPGFTRAAVDALADAAFRPALKNGRPVRQVVQLPFIFEPPRPEKEP